MRLFCLGVLFGLLIGAYGGTQGQIARTQPEITTPTVTTKTEKQVQEYVTVTHTCPAGYEGHYVDTQPGFDLDYAMHLGGSGPVFGNEIWVDGPNLGEQAYTVCFKKDFMDKVRANKDLLTNKPLPPHGV